MKYFIVSALVSLLAVSPTLAKSNQVLTGPELKKFFSGKTYKYVNKKGKTTAVITYNRDGTIASNRKGKKTAPGKWSVKGNKYCTSYSYRPKTKCFQVRPTKSSRKWEDLANGKLDGYFVK